jgi:hypothetical protein
MQIASKSYPENEMLCYRVKVMLEKMLFAKVLRHVQHEFDRNMI